MENWSGRSLILSAVLALAVCGCSSGPKVETPKEVAPPPPEEAATELTAPTLPPPPTGEPLPGAGK